MEYDVNELKIKVDEYFLGRLTKENLGKWAEKAYYELLKGGYVEKKKVVLYPFLKIISKFHIESNDIEDVYPCTEEEVKDIQQILHGNLEFDYQIEMAIPLHIYNNCINKKCFDINKRDFYCKLRENIICLGNNHFETELSEMIKLLLSFPIADETIQDMLESHIIKIVRTMFDITKPELAAKARLKLYAINSKQNSLLKKLSEYLESYTGSRDFNILITFKKGVPDLILLV